MHATAVYRSESEALDVRIDTLDAMVAQRRVSGYQGGHRITAPAPADPRQRRHLLGVRWSGRGGLRNVTDTSTWRA